MRCFSIVCPGGQGRECKWLFVVGECDTAGIKHGGGVVVPGAVFVVAYKGIGSAGKLHTDLVTSAGVQTDAHKRGFVISGQLGIFKPCFFDTCALPFDNKDLVFSTVLKQ